MRPRAIPRQPLVTTHPTPSTPRCCYSCSFFPLYSLCSRVMPVPRRRTTTCLVLEVDGDPEPEEAKRTLVSTRLCQPASHALCTVYVSDVTRHGQLELPSFLLVRDRDEQRLRHEVCAAVCCDGPIVHYH